MRTPTFGLDTEFFHDEVVVSARGDLDIASGLQLQSVVEGVMYGGGSHVVVDLASCRFVDVAGLRALDRTAESLTARGQQMTVRSPSPAVRRLVGMLGGPDEGWTTTLGPSTTPAAPPQPGAQTARVRRRPGGDTAAPDLLVDAALGMVVRLSHMAVEGSDGVSVSLRRNGHLTTVAATDATVSAMDADQYATGEGPCIEASVEGKRFLAESLADESRWPAFTPRARALGINSILSSPLLAGDRAVGSLNIYSLTPGAFATEDQRRAALFAAGASEMLADISVDTSEGFDRRITEALRSRHNIALAQGILMERNGVDEADAFTLLRRFSVRTGQPLRQRAVDLVAARGRARRPPPSPLPPPGSGG